MSETKFTPSPWKALPDDIGHIFGDAYCTIDDGSKAIAYVMLRDRPRGRDISEWRDNAHLIAAAPDLHEVAAAYEQWEADLILCSEAWGTADYPTITEELWDRLLDIQAMRNAALAKARGETP